MNVGRRRIADYRAIVDQDLMAEIHELATGLRGLRLCHVSAWGDRGGVAELLNSTVPLLNDMGLDTHWMTLNGSEEFFHAAEVLHAGLQGSRRAITDHEMAVFERYSLLNAGGLGREFDVVIVHDPHPLGLQGTRAALDDATWIWRCHLDMSAPNPHTLERIRPILHGYDMCVFHMPDYVPDGVVSEPVVISPAIDPLTPKNMGLSAFDTSHALALLGVDPDRPLMVQVSRFDRWKDPRGVIDAYRLARQEIPDLQLAILGPRGVRDENGADEYERTVDHAGGDPAIHLFTDEHQFGAVEVNALQSRADVVVQKSLREGFGLTVTEALWKARPVVASDVGGIPTQISDGETGFLVSSVEDCAMRVVELVQNPERAAEMALNGKRHVRNSFLTPRLLRDWLGILRRASIR